MADRPRALVRALAIASGGVAGATARWGLLAVLPDSGPFPWNVLAINIAGSLLLGAFLAEDWREPRLRLLLHEAGAIGYCGGLTTFATYSVGIVDLVKGNQVETAIAYAAASVLASVAAVFVGAATVRRWRATDRRVEERP